MGEEIVIHGEGEKWFCVSWFERKREIAFVFLRKCFGFFFFCCWQGVMRYLGKENAILYGRIVQEFSRTRESNIFAPGKVWEEWKNLWEKWKKMWETKIDKNNKKEKIKKKWVKFLASNIIDAICKITNLASDFVDAISKIWLKNIASTNSMHLTEAKFHIKKKLKKKCICIRICGC